MDATISTPIEPKFSNELPPKKIYDKAVEQFGVDFYNGIIFTVGDTIYSNQPLSYSLEAHEYTHVLQQTSIGYKKWWKQYFKNEEFRLIQETEAYRNQYKFIEKTTKDRNKRFKYLNQIAKELSSPMYGSIISYKEAIKLIKQ